VVAGVGFEPTTFGLWGRKLALKFTGSSELILSIKSGLGIL